MTLSGTDTPSTIRVLIGEQGWLGLVDQTDKYCTITYSLDGLGTADYPEGAAYDAAFEFDFGAATLIEDACAARLGVDFAADSFDDPTADLSTWKLRYALGATVPGTPKAEPAEWSGAWVIGTNTDFTTTTTTTPPGTPAFAWAEQVDANFADVLDANDAPVPLVATDVPTANGVASAYYHLNAINLWFFPPNFD